MPQEPAAKATETSALDPETDLGGRGRRSDPGALYSCRASEYRGSAQPARGSTARTQPVKAGARFLWDHDAAFQQAHRERRAVEEFEQRRLLLERPVGIARAEPARQGQALVPYNGGEVPGEIPGRPFHRDPAGRFQEQGLDDLLVRRESLNSRNSPLSHWREASCPRDGSDPSTSDSWPRWIHRRASPLSPRSG